MSRDPDVLVVGCGPAGSSLALRLAEAGIRVRLLDARRFPRSKPCGDAISPGSAPLLEELGVEPAVRRRAALMSGWRVRAQDGRWFEGTFDPGVTSSPPVGYALPRAELDQILLEAAIAAGADYRPQRRVFQLERGGNRVIGARARGPSGHEEVHRARLVVGADGLRSRVARRLGTVRHGRRRRLAIVGRFAGVTADGGTGELRLSADGVLGYAPLGESRCNVTVVVPRSEARALSRDLDGYFRSRLREYGIADRLEGARAIGPLEVTGPFEVQPTRRTAPGALLVGDAAGYFDPFTGQGIFRALTLGRLAATLVRRALERPDLERTYRQAYERSLGRFLRPSRRVQRLIDGVVSRPTAMGFSARLLAGRPGLASLLVDVTGDRVPPGVLVNPRRLARAYAVQADPRAS